MVSFRVNPAKSNTLAQTIFYSLRFFINIYISVVDSLPICVTICHYNTCDLAICVTKEELEEDEQ